MKLENYGPQGNVVIMITKPHKSCIFLFFHNNFQDTKGTKMADPILESSLKSELNTIYSNVFLLSNKKVDKFQLCLKTAASLFPFSCLTFLIKSNYEFDKVII